MNREELIELICPFENALKCKDDIYSISCDDCKAELNKMLDEYDAKVRADERAKVIDEFVAFANTMPTVEDADGYIRPMRLEEMAEQLKEQKNGRCR